MILELSLKSSDVLTELQFHRVALLIDLENNPIRIKVISSIGFRTSVHVLENIEVYTLDKNLRF